MSDTPPALAVILAEFQAIRAVIERSTTSLLTLISFNVTAVAAVSGFVLSRNADPRLLLVLPVLSSGLGLLVFDQDWGIRVAREYMKKTLQPLAAQYTGDDRLLTYTNHATRSPQWVIVSLAIPYGLLFPGVSIIALAVVTDKLRSLADWSAWTLGATLSLVLLVVWSTRLRDLRSA